MSFSSAKKNLLVLIALTVLALLLYYPILNNEFLSDDYDSLYRICIEKKILFREFLRPLIDISFYLNYLISGLHTWSYYAFNLIIHILNAFLLYRFALSFSVFSDRRQEVFALVSAFLFLIYPFHNEGVVWLTGRLSSMACFFGLLILNLWLSSLQWKLKLLLCLCFYFVGLLAYESILLLPVIIIILIPRNSFHTKQFFTRLLWAIVVIGLSLLVRFLISGAVYGDYGGRMVDLNLSLYFTKAFKTFGRSVLPPSENAILLQVGFCILIVLFIWLHFKTIKKYRSEKLPKLKYIEIVVVFFVAMIIPMLFGISTRTPEGDRLLYFPSLFLCMILSFWGISLLRSNGFRWLYFSILSVYFIYFLALNNRQWEKASTAISGLFAAIAASNGKPVYLINVPDELEGAFVYRNGFKKSLVLHHVDTSKVFTVNYLTRLEYLNFNGTISPEKEHNKIIVPPYTQIINKGDGMVEIENQENGESFFFNKKGGSVYYWNKSDFVPLF